MLFNNVDSYSSSFVEIEQHKVIKTLFHNELSSLMPAEKASTNELRKRVNS